MTDKEIIIDGVDITECDHFSMGLPAFNDPCTLYPHQTRCSKNKNCYFKQLQRKEQECEELKERLKCKCFDPKSNNNRCISYNRIAEDYERDLQRLTKITQEYEELKRTISTLEGVNKLFENNLDSSFIKIVRYKQALEKIEEIANSNRCEGDNCDECPFACECNLKDITNIINEVKGDSATCNM